LATGLASQPATQGLEIHKTNSMNYIAILVGCNKVEPEILVLAPELVAVKTHLSTLLEHTIDDYLVDPETDPMEESEKPWAPELDYQGQQWVYSLPKSLLPKIFQRDTCTCSGSVYIVETTGAVNVRKLMDTVREVIV
jgi:hypothetical protein